MPELMVSWGDGEVIVELKPTGSQWRKIQAGEKVALEGAGFVYDGEDYQDVWYFNHDGQGSLRVCYDDADGFVGEVSDALR